MTLKTTVLWVFVADFILICGANIDLGQCNLALNCEGQSLSTNLNQPTKIEGPPGVRGPQGLKGEKGNAGKIGPMGLIGRKGEVGPQGVEGKPGMKGDPGVKGKAGEVGLKGERGETGERGSPGEKGVAGPKGEPGNSGSIPEVQNLKEQVQFLMETKQYEKSSFEVEPPLENCECPEVEILRERINNIVKQFKPKSCDEVFDYPGKSNLSVYEIYPLGPNKAYTAMCNIRSPTEKWTVIQRRFDGSQDFFLGWNSYKRGFGHASSEYWLGLDIIHQLTSNEDQMLRVELEDHDGNHAYAEYTSFVVGPESDNYRLQIKGYSGNAGDALLRHNRMEFSTRGHDNDVFSEFDCANYYRGPWWHEQCYDSNLNGLYITTKASDYTSMNWYEWKGDYEPLKSSTMMIRKNN